MRTLPLLPVLLLAACGYPRFAASKTVEFTVPAADLQRLHCETHNGGITITGKAEATDITVRAELSVRGYTQAEADANLHLLEVGSDKANGTLKLYGKYPRGELMNRSPSFAFTLTMPAGLEAELESHNGSMQLTGLAGSLKSTSHNGDVRLQGACAKVAIETHNGDVTADLAGKGALDGSLVTHNGNVVLAFPGAVDATLEASTHNGSLHATRLTDAKVSRRQLSGRLGAGTGKLSVTTHNGDVTVN